MRRYAFSATPTAEAQAAGPVSGMVWPILISRSVTPGAFSAAAGIAIAPPSSKQPSKIRNIPCSPLVRKPQPRRYKLIIADQYSSIFALGPSHENTRVQEALVERPVLDANPSWPSRDN